MEFINKEKVGNNIGIYKITMFDKVYVGSAAVSFLKRYNHHNYSLKNNKHKNAIMQRYFNKYGIDCFCFEVLEITTKDIILEREQFWINYLESHVLSKNGLNINPLATGGNQFSKETIQKRSAAIKKYWEINGTDTLKGKKAWNKGKILSEEHKTKLKKSHNLNPEYHKIRHKQDRERMKNVEVLFNDVSIGIWSSGRYLEEWSMTNIIPNLKTFCKKSVWRGIPFHVLQFVNILKACRTGKPYKSLTFKYTLEAPTFCEEY